MTSPKLPSLWIIDFRTAQQIFASGSNVRISKIVEMVKNGELFVCDCELDLFKSDEKLSNVILNGSDCVIYPEAGGDILSRAGSIANSNAKFMKKLLTGNESAIIIAATAISKKCGLISDHEHLVWTTVCDICWHYDVIVISSEQYFKKFPPN